MLLQQATSSHDHMGRHEAHCTAYLQPSATIFTCQQALTGTRYPTLPGKVLKISGFRVVTIHAVSIQDYINDASYLAPEGRDSSKMAKSFISPLYWIQKYASDNLSEVFTLFCSELGHFNPFALLS